jgi:hypothetical protein
MLPLMGVTQTRWVEGNGFWFVFEADDATQPSDILAVSRCATHAYLSTLLILEVY